MDPLYRVEPNFFDEAEELRRLYDERFENAAGKFDAVWNYWYIPEAYTYLRTDPSVIFTGGILERFQSRLRAWSREHLGLSLVDEGVLSFYISGCGQALHNDALNGRMAFVYSLTRWDDRRFTGGSTLIMPEDSYWDSNAICDEGGYKYLLHNIEPAFNQLLVFDDRAIHGVQTVLGTMDPREARVVMHGHIRRGGAFVDGALPEQEAVAVWKREADSLWPSLEKFGKEFSGVFSFRLHIDPSGEVRSVVQVWDRMRPLGRAAHTWSSEEMMEIIRAWGLALRFPKAEGTSKLTIPLTLGAR